MCQIAIEIQPSEKIDINNTSDKDVCDLVMMCIWYSFQKINYGDRKFFKPVINIQRAPDTTLDIIHVWISATYIHGVEVPQVITAFLENIAQSSLAGQTEWTFNKSLRSF